MSCDAVLHNFGVAFGYLLLALCLLLPVGGSADGVPHNSRVDCAPQPSDKQENCVQRGCVWDSYFEPLYPSTPLCYFPRNSGYVVDDEHMEISNEEDKKVDTKIRLKNFPWSAHNPYDTAFEHLNVEVKQIRMSTLKITIKPDEKRYVPPVPLNEGDNCRGDVCSSTFDSLKFHYEKTPVFSFTVERPDGAKIWDTSIGGLMFGDKFIQIATYLPTDRIYGFAENIHQTFKHDFSQYRTWGMFSIDEATNSVTYNRNNHYGVHPFYMGLDSATGKAHGVFIFNSNAQEVSTGPAPHLVYRTIGGQLDIYFFAGPRPEDVIRQYQDLIGRPYLPSYWAFGFQLCRFRFVGVEDIRAAVKRTQDAKIPLDVIYSDIDYMDGYKDFTLNKEEAWEGFPKFVDEIHEQNMKLILIFDPAIQADDDAFKRAIEKSASFIEWPRADLVQQSIQDLYPLAQGTRIMLGVVWPEAHVAFPDFLDPANITQRWWIDEFKEFHKKVPFDGIWIDMNEPSNFETNSDDPQYPDGHSPLETLKCPLEGNDAALDVPPYPTWHVFSRGDARLSSKTLCMLGKSGRGSHTQYDVHSIYGWAESVATNAALYETTNERASLFSRSTFPGSGVYAGHWLGDNFAHWEDLRTSIIGIQEFNLFGIPFVGADVCGFIGATTEELCLRWQQLGAFYPFYRNHNDDVSPPQDPAQWPSVATATRAANLFRYRHLPYLYSLHFRASIYGGTVVRPLFFEFPTDPLAVAVADSQFMWGESIIVVPVTTPNADFVHAYLPVNEIWYSGSSAHDYGVMMPSGFSDFNAPHDTPLPVFIRGGSVIPRQKPSVTLTESRKNEFQLLAALKSNSSMLCYKTASGELFWDDGKTIFDDPRKHDYLRVTINVTATCRATNIIITCISGCYSALINTLPPLNTIEVFGYSHRPSFSSATLNGKPLSINTKRSSYWAAKKVLKIHAKSMVDFGKDGPKWTISLKNLQFFTA